MGVLHLVAIVAVPALVAGILALAVAALLGWAFARDTRRGGRWVAGGSVLLVVLVTVPVAAATYRDGGPVGPTVECPAAFDIEPCFDGRYRESLWSPVGPDGRRTLWAFCRPFGSDEGVGCTGSAEDRLVAQATNSCISKGPHSVILAAGRSEDRWMLWVLGPTGWFDVGSSL